MQSTEVGTRRCAWELRDSSVRVRLVQEDGVTVRDWPGMVTLEEAVAELPEHAPLWRRVREDGQRHRLAVVSGARQHADFFHLPTAT